MKNQTCKLDEFNQDLMMALLNLDAIANKTDNEVVREMVLDVRGRILNLAGIQESDALNADLAQLAKLLSCDDCKSYCTADLVKFLEKNFLKP